MRETACVDPEALSTWLRTHLGWHVSSSSADKPPHLSRTFTFPNFADALAFAVRVGALAEQHDHHPEIFVRWGACTVQWWTHTAKGVTALDFALSEHTDALYEAK